jgi:hypothetical protein
MKTMTKLLTSTCILLFVFSSITLGQGGSQPLTVQGLNQVSNVSAASLSMGGVVLNTKNDISAMFANPATLQSLSGIQVSVGVLQQYKTFEQTQNWVPLKAYGNFSILMDGTVRNIAPIVLDTSVHNPQTMDTLYRPLDSIMPDWKYKKNQMLPRQVFIAVPLTVLEKKLVVGAGIYEYANLNYYYSNNNVLSKDLGLTRAPVDTAAANVLPIYWSAHNRQRDGSIYGYGATVALVLNDQITLGIAATILSGSTRDNVAQIGRGCLLFTSHYFRLRPYQYDTITTGTSDYSGQEFVFSGILNNKYITLGFTIKPPTTITRDYNATTTIDTAGRMLTSRKVNGTDEIVLPWRGTIGLSASIKQNVTMGIELELSPYASAVYLMNNSTYSRPWLDVSSVKFGIEYLPISWLALRGGYHSQQEVYQAFGSPIDKAPVTYDVFSAGVGLSWHNVRLNLAFEFFDRQYEDLWLTNGNVNKESQYNIAAEISYTLQ